MAESRGPAAAPIRVRKKRRSRPWPRVALAAAAVVALVALVDAVHLGFVVRDLSEGVGTLQMGVSALGSNPGSWTAERIASGVRYDEVASRQLGPAAAGLEQDPLLAILDLLPVVSDQVRAARDLGNGAASAGRAFHDEVLVARMYEEAKNADGTAGEKLLALLTTTAAPLSDGADSLRAPVEALEADRRRRLLPPLGHRVTGAATVLRTRYDEVAAAGAAARLLPRALGAGGPRTYLLLLPDPDELRPAGGFSGVVGTATFNRGNPTVAFENVDEIDQKNKPHPFPPPAEPISARATFNYGGLSLGDLFDPNFPTMAQLSEAIYKRATGASVDGTIALDPYAIAALLEVTGPVSVPVYGDFSSSNFFDRFQGIVNANQGPQPGKRATAPIANAILRRILTQPVSAYPKLAAVIQAQAARRHVQLALHEPPLSAAATKNRLDGAILPAIDDYLMVVDANIGATKGDRYLHKSLEVRAEIPDSGLSRHEVTMTYRLPPPTDAVDRFLNSYVAYQDYVRFYLPRTAVVRGFQLTMDGQPGQGALDDVREMGGKQVIGVFFRLPRDHEVRIRLNYEVALRGGHGDQIYIQKQAGIPGYPLDLTVSYPGGVQRLQTDLSIDRFVRVSW